MNDADDLAVALAESEIRRIRVMRENAALRAELDALRSGGSNVTVLKAVENMDTTEAQG